MAKLVLTDTQSGYQQAATINANNAAVEAALENTLSRDGTAPNSMSADLDMNSHSVINLKAPTNPNDAARLTDLQNVSAIIGTTVPSQSGKNGYQLSSDGANLVFTQVIPAQGGNAGKQLQTDGSVVSWQPAVPGQAGNSGKFLTTDGTNSSWALPLPTQAGNNGRILTTDGTVASWTPNLAFTQVAAIRSSAQSVSGTTLTTDNTLSLTIPSTGYYRLNALLFVNTGNTGNGFKYQWGGTAVMGSGAWTAQGTNNSAVTLNNYTTASAIATHTSTSLTMDTVEIIGYMNCTTTGTFFLTWAMNAVVAASTTMNIGSWLLLTKLT